MSTLKVQNIQHTNGTSGITISSGGIITQPTIPCCQCRLTTSNAQDTSNRYTTSGTDIRFDRIEINQGNCYSESTGRFTVPVAGIYEVRCHFLTDTSTTTNSQINILKNGTSFHRGYMSVDNQFVELHAHALVECIAGNYITARLDQGELYISADGIYSSFFVRLVG